MKKALFLSILGLFLTVSAHAQVAQPDCILTLSFTSAGRAVYDNRGLALPVCTTWHLTYSNDGFSALSIEIDSAPTSGNSPGTWAIWTAANLASGTLPLTTTTQNQITAFKFFPWVSINVTSTTGTGTLRANLYGYRPNFSNDANSSGVAGSGAANGSPTSGNPVLIAGSDGTSTRTIATTNVTGGAAILATVSPFVPADGQTPAAAMLGQAQSSPAIFGPLGTVSWVRTQGVGGAQDQVFYCNKTVVLAALGAATTQIVAGVASQKIRICHVYISNNAANALTVTFVEGTGANCATGQTALTGKILLNANTLAGDDIDIALGNGSPWITNTAADALCATGVGTGSADITITEAQY